METQNTIKAKKIKKTEDINKYMREWRENHKVDKETRHNHYLRFKENNTDKIHDTKICDICGGRYSYYSKSNHFQKCRKHLMAIEKMQLMSEIEELKKTKQPTE